MSATPEDLERAVAEFRKMITAAVAFGLPGTLTAEVDGRTMRKVDYRLHVTGAALQAVLKGGA